MISAYHTKQGQIRPRVPLVKMVASAITLGPADRGGAGPIAQIGAGFGSLLSNLFGFVFGGPPHSHGRRQGSGIAAIFAPVGRHDFCRGSALQFPGIESEGIIPRESPAWCRIAFSANLRAGSLCSRFPILPSMIRGNWGLIFVLALCMALLDEIHHSFYGCQRLFGRLPLPRHFRPAVGAF